MSALLEPEQDTALAVQLFSVRKTASDEEFGKLLSKLLGTCRHEGFRIAIKALQIVLNESNVERVAIGLKEIKDKPEFMAKYEHKQVELRIPVRPKSELTERPAPIPHIQPMRTREQALEIHRKNHPEMYNADGTRKGYEKMKSAEARIEAEDEDLEQLERETRPDPIDAGSEEERRKPIDDTGKADIRKRYKQAKADSGGYRVERGFMKRLAAEYKVRETRIYQIVYSDPDYVAIPRA